MYLFCLTYFENAKLQPLVGELCQAVSISKYARRNPTHLLGVATYSTSAKLPANYKKFLPSKSDIEKRLSDFFNKEKE
ncbi:MAG: hypothetical protein HY958_03715 [Bacteroidia bacterium]|nr:hypothetical protein [Bacteroidia bacterium]